ncbi:hypothetical protein ACF07V_26385 [Streptomyces sp. NPDC015661]|uniref:hypothetical protein n=1 Tax=Streptomyces sp. NPDC015661 TaxID=3364961 RepID=UPI0036FDFDE2
MYLIHAQLASPAGMLMPCDAAAKALRLARPEEGVEHVSAHANGPRGPVLGVYLLADSLAQAEARTAALCERLLTRHPGFTGWSLRRAEAAFLAPLGHGLLGPPARPTGGPAGRAE